MKVFRIFKKCISSSKERRKYRYLLPYALGSKHILSCSAKRIAKKNSKQLGKTQQPYLKIETYDKSNQMVHPDSIFWKEKIWLVLTPYPYSIDTYENPCLFSGTSIFSLKPIDNNPLAFPTIRAKKSHISDPWLSVIDDRLYVFFRDTIYTKGTTTQKLFYRYSENGVDWSDKFLFTETNEYDFVSPATIDYSNCLYHFFVKLNGISGGDIWRIKTDKNLKHIEIKKCICNNVPHDMHVWHIGLCTNNSFSKKMGEKLYGLFTLRGKEKIDQYKLFWASSYDEGTTWFVEEEVSIPPSLLYSINHVYKCCVLPITGDIVLSYYDNFYRWYFSVIPGYYDRDNTTREKELVFLDSYRLFSRVFNSSISFDGFINKHLNNPFIISHFYTQIIDNNKVIGTNCFDGALLQTSHGEFRIAQSCDTAVDVDARGRGVFTKMINQYVDRVKNTDLDMLIGFPNFNSIHGFTKMGWELKATFPSLIRITKPFSVFLSKITGHFKQRKQINTKQTKVLASIGIDDISQYDACPFDEHDVATINNINRVHIKRTIDYFKWKLDSQNDKHFKYFVFRKRDDIVAYFIYWVNSKGRLFIVDWFFNHAFEPYFISIVESFINRASRICNVIVFECLNSASVEYNAILRIGFFNGQKRPYRFYTKKLLAYSLKEDDELKAIQESEWFLTSIDIDTIFD